MELLKRIRAVIDNICMNHMKIDGTEHLIAGILIVSVLQWILSVWIAVAITLVILVAKELVYDKWLGQGVAEWRDVFWGMVGLLLGIL